MIKKLLDKEVQQFIIDHENDSPANLMLHANQFPDLDMPEIINQIISRNKAKHKLPEWYKEKGLIWPKPISMEQCSSQKTAEYKSSLVSGRRMVDLTGGFGVDTYYFSKRFERSVHIEQDKRLHQIAEHNFKQLNASIKTDCSKAEDYLKGLDSVDFIYLDPSRRNNHQEKVVFLEDYSPNVLGLKASLLKVAKVIMIKVSPILDIKKVIQDFPSISEVHIVSVKNEVKELLIVLNNGENKEPRIKAVNFNGYDDQVFDFTYSEEEKSTSLFSEVSNFLYEPNPSILKAGAFKSVGQFFGLKKLEVNSHLYTSDELTPHFPGRTFKVIKEITFNKKKLRKELADHQANITVRNYPASVKEIRKKTGIEEGGDQYILATTDKKGKRVLLCQKI